MLADLEYGEATENVAGEARDMGDWKLGVLVRFGVSICIKEIIMIKIFK